MGSSFGRGITIGALTFLLSVVINLASETVSRKVGVLPSFFILVTIVFLGILADIVGTAVTAADEKPFLSMAANRVPGARHALRLIRNADAVANFCNDIIGDICGTVSGAVTVNIVARIVLLRPGWNEAVLSLFMLAFTAALTVGGKAAGKQFSISQATAVVLGVGKFLYLIERAVGVDLTGTKRNNSQRTMSRRRKQE